MSTPDPMLETLLKATVDSGSSDLHLTVGRPATARRDGVLVSFENVPVLTSEEVDRMVMSLLDDRKLEYERLEDVPGATAKLLSENKIVAWFQGAMEAGPRALGSRSILMSPLVAENKDRINACVKYREMFRPFCPSMPAERADDYLENARLERFMVTSFRVKADKADRIPAVVHVDGTARPQMVEHDVNPRYHRMIKAFGELTGEPVVLNTSFNIKGEPIVCHPREAIKCFMDTGLDALVIGSYLLRKPRA